MTHVATSALQSRGEPRPSREIIPSSVFAMLLFVFMEIMLFAGLISAHVIFLSQRVGEMWPPPGQPLLPAQATAVNTGALLASGIILFFARFGFARDPKNALVPLAMSVLLGAFFVGSQGVEWIALIQEGLTLTSSVYGAFFYLIVGAHALHAVVAILCLGWAWTKLRKNELTSAHFDTVQLFWYFVVLVWPFLYYQVYLR